jgi:hypothetical protein
VLFVPDNTTSVFIDTSSRVPTRPLILSIPSQYARMYHRIREMWFGEVVQYDHGIMCGRSLVASWVHKIVVSR